jgi:hypothetical protein
MTGPVPGRGPDPGPDRGLDLGPDRGLDRAEVVGMLARFGDRRPAEVGEELGSLELTWLVDQVERDDDVFAGMSTVTGALAVLRRSLPAGADRG